MTVDGFRYSPDPDPDTYIRENQNPDIRSQTILKISNNC